jgi:hypothetical protein
MRKLPNSNSDIGNVVRPTEDRPPSTPRWIKVSGIIVIVLLLLYGILELTGVGGNHGPGQHKPTGNVSGQTQPSSVTEAHTLPGGGH